MNPSKHSTAELYSQLCNITSYDDANMLLSLSFEFTKNQYKVGSQVIRFHPLWSQLEELKVCREGWSMVCVSPWEVVVHSQAPESDTAPFLKQPRKILPEPAVDFKWSSFLSSPKTTWYQPSTDSYPGARPAHCSCASLEDKSQSQARSQPLPQNLAEGSG